MPCSILSETAHRFLQIFAFFGQNGDRFLFPAARSAKNGDRFLFPEARFAKNGDRYRFPEARFAKNGDRYRLPEARSAKNGDRFLLPAASVGHFFRFSAYPRPRTSISMRGFPPIRLLFGVVNSRVSCRVTNRNAAELTDLIRVCRILGIPRAIRVCIYRI